MEGLYMETRLVVSDPNTKIPCEDIPKPTKKFGESESRLEHEKKNFVNSKPDANLIECECEMEEN